MSTPLRALPPAHAMTDTLSIEVLIGIMTTLSITSGIRVMSPDSPEIGHLVAAALATNTAWGFVDGVLHLFNEQVARTRERRQQEAFVACASAEQARAALAAWVPESLHATLSDAQIAQYQQSLRPSLTGSATLLLTWADAAMAMKIWVLMLISTLPPALPLLLVDAPLTAFRCSQAISVGIMFFLGTRVARWIGVSPCKGGALFALLGALITLICILMGG